MSFTAQTAPMLYRLDRFRRRVGMLVSGITNWLLFVAVVLVVGAASSWYMVEVGSRLTTYRQGPWVSWTNAAQRDADPYTRAHFARIGSLPVPSSIAQTYEARIDTDGQRLHSSCEYLVEVDPMEGVWWSLAVFNDRGLLIPNAADRYTFTSQTIALNPDGSFFVVLAREARPGNWLPVGGAGRLTLQLTVLEPRIVSAEGNVDRRRTLPAIRRISCR